MARAELKVSDNGYRQLLENIKAAKAQTVIRAGIFQGPPRPEAEADGLSNAEIGAIHEFGLGHVPERSFIRGTVDANRSEINARLKAVAGGIFKARDEIKRGAALFGEWFVGKMKMRIRDGIAPALKQETIDRKHSSTPLIDHGELLGSLTYDVKQGGGAE